MEPDNNAPSLIEYYQFTTEQIMRTQTLVTNRGNWLIALQGFLFTAIGFSRIAKASPQSPIIFNVVIPILGVVTSLFAFHGLNAAYTAINEVKESWNERADGHMHLFPPAFPSKKAAKGGRIASTIIPLGFSVVWIAILIFSNWTWIYRLHVSLWG